VRNVGFRTFWNCLSCCTNRIYAEFNLFVVMVLKAVSNSGQGKKLTSLCFTSFLICQKLKTMLRSHIGEKFLVFFCYKGLASKSFLFSACIFFFYRTCV
jgi:hypothetical protein